MSLTIEQWEFAEKKRSAFAASQTDASQLRANVENIKRYLNPPADTVYPLEYAFSLLGDISGKVVLEYGCGDGINTLMLADRGAHVIALDLSLELLALARKRLEVNHRNAGVDFILGSAHNLPLPDESVDVVFGMAILHHLDLGLSSREVQRVLRKGGRGIFEEPLRNSKLVKGMRKLIPSRAPDISPYERPLTDQELEAFGAGWQYRSKSFQLPTSRFIESLPYLKKLNDKLCPRVDASLLKTFPPLAYYSSVKVFEITKPS